MIAGPSDKLPEGSAYQPDQKPSSRTRNFMLPSFSATAHSRHCFASDAQVPPFQAIAGRSLAAESGIGALIGTRTRNRLFFACFNGLPLLVNPDGIQSDGGEP